MGVVGTRVSVELGERVEGHCRAVGKTPSQWLRDLIQGELEGKAPAPALGEALQGVAQEVAQTSQLLGHLLRLSVGTLRLLAQGEMMDHPERAGEVLRIYRQSLQGLAQLPGALKVEMGVRVSDLASEIERLRGISPKKGGKDD